MPQQSQESLEIKKVNQQMIELAKIELYNSPNITKYERTIRQLGLETELRYSKQLGRHIMTIKNTKANRAKIPAVGLANTIAQKGGKSVKQIRDKVRADLKAQGKKADNKSVTREITKNQMLSRIYRELNYIPSHIVYITGVRNEKTDVGQEISNMIDEYAEMWEDKTLSTDNLIDIGEDLIDKINEFRGGDIELDDIIDALT